METFIAATLQRRVDPEMLVNYSVYLVITIYMFFREKACRKKKVSLLRKILEEPEDFQVFLSVCTEWYSCFSQFLEFSLENVVCFQDLQKLKKLNSEPRILFAKEMYEKYFEGQSSELEVNIQRKYCDAFKREMDAREISDSTLGDIESGIMLNLIDTHSRFVFTNECKQIERRIGFEIELLGKE